MATLPFATKPSPYSVWGCSDFTSNVDQKQMPSFHPSPTARSNGHANATQNMESSSSSEASYPSSNYEYMPAVLLNSLKREKKPFTYTPGRVDLSEVLNDKLRQRMERRKKRAEERSLQRSPVQELPTFEPPKQVLVMPTYNSPINMYSMENALEALEVQAEITVSDKSLSPPSRSHSMTLPRNYKYEPVDYEPKNVTQSKAFRVLQIITDTEEETGPNGPKTNSPEKSPGQSHQNETRFGGTRTSDVIPSKLFHNLQKITGTEEESSNALTQSRTVSDINSERHRDEMRFIGTRPNKVIPSKLFHNLQRITGTEEEEAPDVTSRKSPGPITASNSGVWEVQFRPKDDMLRQVKNTLLSSKDEKETSIPVLQRPAAFLPAKQTVRTNQIKSYPRFNATSISNRQANSTHLFGGTDF